ncbi:MAG: hypothetical protein J0M08_03755 [Bacteroidetes bacterium]|nr:hypothetical protein [Bacteroidota bacterium]
MKFTFLISTLILFFNISAQTSLLKKGEKAPDFEAVEISTRADKKLSSINSDYCLVVFYMKSYDILGLKNVYTDYKSKGLKIYAVCICDNCDPEIKRLEDLKIEWTTVRPWGNAYTKKGNINKYFIISPRGLSRPVYYLLDKEKITLSDRINNYKKLELELKKAIK